MLDMFEFVRQEESYLLVNEKFRFERDFWLTISVVAILEVSNIS